MIEVISTLDDIKGQHKKVDVHIYALNTSVLSVYTYSINKASNQAECEYEDFPNVWPCVRGPIHANWSKV